MAFLGKFGSRLGHGFNGEATEGITDKMAVGGKIFSNVDINRNNTYSRLLNDEKGFGGSEHGDKAMAEISHYKEARNRRKEGNNELRQLQKERGDMERDPAKPDMTAIDNMIKAQQTVNLEAANEKGLFGTAAGVTKHTFNAMNSGTAGQIASKWGMVAGAGIVVNGAGRAMTGGGVTYNSSGQRDIMGIPLI